MITTERMKDLVGSTVYGTDGDSIGTIRDVYVDDATGELAWATVRTGLFGTKETFVPMHGADTARDGVTVPYDKATVKDAPRIDADGHLSPAEEQELYRHYGVEYGTGTTGGTYGTADVDPSGTAGMTGAGTAATPATTSRAGTDDAMTLSEERVHVGTERRETGRVRLRKYVVTENVTTTVPVTREEVRLEREPITDGNVDDALRGQEISGAEHEVVLHEERPVVEKATVPVERVRLGTDTVTEDVTVDESVRREEIETDGDTRHLR